MGFSSMDDIVSEITNGKFVRTDWQKITGAAAYAAGRWYDFSKLGGFPIANAHSGTALAWTSCDETTGNGTQIFGLPMSGAVTPDTKHVLNVSAVTAVATGVPSQLMLVDLQGYWPGISINSAVAQNLTGTPTLRYTNGAGCRAFFVNTVTSGATAHNIAISYTNQAGTTGRTLPVTVAMTASAITPHIAHTGTAANNYGPFLPMASGDSGMQNVASVTFSAASGAGTGALCIAKIITILPLSTTGITAERDLLNQLPSLPQVKDGACLVWLYFSGAAVAANTTFYGAVEAGWG
jgi:hypothetical protein